jgi:uncharacterized protein
MKIDVVKLKENRIENFKESLTPASLDLDITAVVRYIGSIDISTDAKKEMSLVFTNTHFSAKAEFTCSRCLKQYVDVIEKDLQIQYPLEGFKKFIDITEDIREEIILDHPVVFLCKPDCRGLCFKCGQDLNQGQCDCGI